VRTTLNLDDDVLRAARDRARREGRSIGLVISELARQALTGRAAPGSDEPLDEQFLGFRPLPSRGPGVTNELIDQLREDEPA
jgi:hypothetical protein